MTLDPPFGTDEASRRIFGPLCGTAIGGATTASNVRIQHSDASKKAALAVGPALKLQFSHALLWRAYGDSQSLQGSYKYEHSRREIIGFQSFQPAGFELDAPAYGTEDAMLKVELAVHTSSLPSKSWVSPPLLSPLTKYPLRYTFIQRLGMFGHALGDARL